MQPLGGAAAIRVFSCFAFAYFLSYAFRAINAVIAPSLVADIGLSNADLGLLSSAYFLTFAALQLPLGVCLDRYGPRRTEAALLLLAAAGAILFATSTSLAGLWLGRALIGAGVSACLMAPYTAYRRWFAPERQNQLASWMLMAGTAGALASTVPVNAAIAVIGWRGVFWVMAAMVLAASLAIFFLVRKTEAARTEPAPATSTAGTPPAQGYRHVFSHPYFRRMAPIGFVNFGSFVALQTLWAGPWMTTVLGMDKQTAANVLFAFNFCLLLAYLVLSWWAPRHVSQDGRRGFAVERVVTAGIVGAIAVQALIILFPAPWSWLLWLALPLFIIANTLGQTSIGLSFHASLAGRANTAFNLLLFVGAFVVQWGIGLLIDLFQAYGAAPATAMRLAFGACLAAQVAAATAFMVNRARPQTV